MRKNFTAALMAVALAGASVLATTPADAQWRGHHGGYHHHRGGGGGAIAGFAAGALLGGALAANRPYYYGGGPYAYSAGPYGNDATQYCLSRFKSYDPASGTYLGYDGYRHPCP